jgi:hypothetical protein
MLLYYEEMPEFTTKSEAKIILDHVKKVNPNFYEIEVGFLEENTAYICGTHTDWKIKKMIDFDVMKELMKPENDEAKIAQKGSIKEQQTLQAFKHEMDEDLCGYNSLKDDSIYNIHHVPA